ncbi:MAG: integrase core domain-containing protein [Verrucomicrobiota bacterium]
MNIQPIHLILAALTSWLTREQAEVIKYLQEENRVLRERLPSKRIRFTDAERCRLAKKAMVLGRARLKELCPIVTPDTLLRWHRQLVAEKYDGTQGKKRVGRPPVMLEIRRLVIRMAEDNSSWGYTRIKGALMNVGHEVGRTTIARILKEEGIVPAPDRSTKWSTFLQAHWEVIAATDFFTVEVWIKRSLIRFHVLFIIELASRRVEVLGIVPGPDGVWMEQMARNATDGFSGFLLGKRFLIADRDPLYTKKFRATLADSGVKVLRLPARSPNLNAYAERFVRSIKEECLGRMIFFSEEQLRTAVMEYVEHYHAERNHQGLENQLIKGVPKPGDPDGEVVRHSRLGGLLNYYRMAA